MSELTKDQSIVAQVAAKIAADLTTKYPDRLDEAVADWAAATQTVYAVLGEMHGWAQVPMPVMPQGPTIEQATEMVMAAFPRAVEAAPSELSVRIKGRQHGDIPDWLVRDAAAAGVTEVWDNRDGLALNPKRPHFKSTTTDKAFWPPRGRAA